MIQRFLEWWQQALTSMLHRPKAVSVTSDGPADEAARAPRDLLTPQSPALAWAGGIAVSLGAIGTIALSSPGQARTIAFSAAAMIIVWAAVRWALLDVVSRHQTSARRAEVRGAWALGSLVWTLGVTPELRALAWAVSAVVTWAVLERVGATRRQAVVCVSIAWGAQAVVVIGSWLAKNAIIAVLASQS